MKKGMRIFSVFAILLVLSINWTVPARAAANGIYIATATPYYVHPVTGVVEDRGGKASEVTGQGMTESVLRGETLGEPAKALIEVDANGKVYATVRFYLMDNIQNPSFSVQNDGHSEFKSVSHSIMKEDLGNNTTDLRFQIPSENAIVRCSFYVTAMGRDVIWYLDFSNLTSGSGDFVTSITVNPETQAQVQTQAQTETTVQETQNSESTEATESIQQESTVSEDILEGVQGLSIYENAEDKEVKKSNSALPIAILVAIIVVAAALGGVFFYKKKKSVNKEELIDESKEED